MRTEAAGGWVEFVAEPSGIGRITFHHPASNSLPAAVLAGLAEAVRAAATHPDVRVVVLASHGDRAFCAGASFDELRAISTPEEGLAFFSGFAHVINAMRTCPKFILARVAGKAVGGGVGLAAAADYAFATSDAAVKLSELAVGIGPFVVGPAVETFPLAPVPADTLVIHGELDDVVSLRGVLDWARPQALPVTVVPGAGHFFHGQMGLLKSLVLRGCRPPAAGPR